MPEEAPEAAAIDFPFAVIPGRIVKDIIYRDIPRIIDIVKESYRAHGAGRSINPPSYFFLPGPPNARIIALPARLGEPFEVAGLKWIASYPENIARGIPRASAVLILNNGHTGYPFALLEASIISAARTAGSAVAAAEALHNSSQRIDRIGFIGTGIIARTIYQFLRGNGWEVPQIYVHDMHRIYAEKFRDLITAEAGARVILCDRPQDVLTACPLIVFATTAATPHITDRGLLRHNPIVLHISLRDLAPEIVLGATNIVDDIGHVMQAQTSLHVTEQACGHRDFVTGTLYDVMMGQCPIPRARPIIFSPFGLGVLDLAVGKYVYDVAIHEQKQLSIEGFFGEPTRW
jgi:ornithine cyclodeaminase